MLQMVKQLLVHSNHNRDISECLDRKRSQDPFRGLITSIIDAGHAFVSDGYELFYSGDCMSATQGQETLGTFPIQREPWQLIRRHLRRAVK